MYAARPVTVSQTSKVSRAAYRTRMDRSRVLAPTCRRRDGTVGQLPQSPDSCSDDHYRRTPRAGGIVDRNRVIGVIVGAAAALLVVIGSVLPWVSLSTGFGSVGLSGTDGHLVGSSIDGTVTLILALVAAACFCCSLLRDDRVLPITGILLACATASIALYDLIDIGRKIADTPSSHFGSVSIGVGLWLTALASLGMVFGSFKAARGSAPIGLPRSSYAMVPRAGQPAAEPEPAEYWVKDPFGRHELRWWNGNKFTDKVMTDNVESTDAPGRRTTSRTSTQPTA